MILYYSNAKVSEQIKRNREGIWQYMADDRNRIRTFKDYENFGLLKYNMVYDRTKILPHFLKITPDAHPMPDRIENYNRSFWEVTEQRAKELLALNQPINVMWSGGIDSTYILYVLRHYANDPDQVRVYGTYNSIIESGDVFDNHIKDSFPYHIKVGTTNTENYKDVDGIFVSGMCGNQLFGPTDNMFAKGGKGMFHHTLGTPETIYEPYEKHINPDLLDFFGPMIKASPRKIETVADLRWYCIFNLDWYTAIYEHKIQIEKKYAESIHGFFDSIPFQEWAINTNEPFTKVPGNPLTHRWQMRDILDKEFGLTHYAQYKDKKISNFAFLDSNWMLLLDNFKNIYDYR